METLLRICCCRGEEDENEVPYRPLENDVQQVRAAPASQTLTGHDNGGVDFTDSVTPPIPKKTKAQEERDLLENILEIAQNNIIDIGHSESSMAGRELALRENVFEKLIRGHDNELRSSTPASPHAFYGENGNFHMKIPDITLPRDISVVVNTEKVHYYLGPTGKKLELPPEFQPAHYRFVQAPPVEFLQGLITGARELHDALSNIAVEHRTELVVYMDL
ncbi:unnamed protein product [Caenorhabditis auriculariae]|uniref:Uncharacterized protein n=1 Tax=Caenorhabditis auriculariae TaxID=2777116 RepID=A0A8S1HKV0_9PELO|nr:unnamed protein product [Caenorhabditis auriculariae]